MSRERERRAASRADAGAGHLRGPPGGTIVMAGRRGTAETPGFVADLIVYKGLHIQGVLGVDVTAYRAALELLEAGRWPFADLPREVVGFDGLDALLAAMAGEADAAPPVHGVLVP